MEKGLITNVKENALFFNVKETKMMFTSVLENI